jgi:hypothetical protein
MFNKSDFAPGRLVIIDDPQHSGESRHTLYVKNSSALGHDTQYISVDTIKNTVGELDASSDVIMGVYNIYLPHLKETCIFVASEFSVLKGS